MSFLWNEIIYKPVYNLLLFFLDILPEASLGIAIILFTIVIRTILLAPAQKAMVQQRKMQKIQPKIKQLQDKHKNDQQKLSAEMMKLWKENDVNPIAGCLPLLLQMPFLYAIFLILKDGINEGTSRYAYSFFSQFDYSTIQHTFFGIDLLQPEMIFLPIIVAAFQFIQLKMMYHFQEQKQAAPANDQQQMIQNTLLYVFPFILFITSMTFSAGLALYWAGSTLYGIGQQLYVNKLIK
ncbi:MAG: YidC/Oxa1 family membrane protein insertase [Patescibacteria group bacterium]|nr:YidC/Oxa1 family membrane protein insertase [Patescibacteria group bacterium]